MQAEVVAKCLVCEPKHGEVWRAVAKELANAYLEPEEVLKFGRGEAELLVERGVFSSAKNFDSSSLVAIPRMHLTAPPLFLL